MRDSVATPDWFKNPDAELKPIIDELNRMTTPISDLGIEIEHDGSILDIEPIEPEYGVLTKAEIQGELDEALSIQSLRSRLDDFNRHTIERKFPETTSAKRLLRNEMLDMLDSERPINLEQFSEFIPNYLRSHTSPEEAAMFLGNVLEIIAVFEEMHSVRN